MNGEFEINNETLKLYENKFKSSNKYNRKKRKKNETNQRWFQPNLKRILFFIIINAIFIIFFLKIKMHNKPKLLLSEKTNNINDNNHFINNSNNLNIDNSYIINISNEFNKTNNIADKELNLNLNNFSINVNNQNNEMNNEKKEKINTVEDFEVACLKKKPKQIAELYYETCSNGILLDKNKYKLVQIPKISIIIPVYNREQYILRILRSIQNQSMKDFEIIFVDDFSDDSSVNLIKNYQKEDERIILIEHSKNEGTLITRNDGVLKAKAEYIMFADSDDILLPNILKESYEIAKKGNYEIILFSIFKRSLRGKYYKYKYIYGRKKVIYQPELSSFMYYGKGYLKQIDFHLVGKLIKKDVFIRAMNSISDYYLKNHMCVNEDGLMNFMLLKKANSLKYIHFFGYIYIANPKSVILTLNSNINKTIRDYFLYLKYMIEYTDNNFHEKSMAEEQLRYTFKYFLKEMIYVTQNFDFLYNVLNMYLNCTYIKEDGKNKTLIMLEKLKKVEKNVKNIEERILMK